MVKLSCYAGGSVTIDRVSRARQVKSDDPNKKGYPGLAGWGSGVRLSTPPHKTPVEGLLKLETGWKLQRRPSMNMD